jgi:hypothetical protein
VCVLFYIGCGLDADTVTFTGCRFEDPLQFTCGYIVKWIYCKVDTLQNGYIFVRTLIVDIRIC